MIEYVNIGEKREKSYNEQLEKFKKKYNRELTEKEEKKLRKKANKDIEKTFKYYKKRLTGIYGALTVNDQDRIWEEAVKDRKSHTKGILGRIGIGIVAFAAGLGIGHLRLEDNAKTEPVQNPNPITTEMPTEELTTELITETDTKGNDFRNGLKVEPETEEETKEDNGKEIIEEFIKDYNEKNNEDIEVNDLRYFISSGQGYGLYQKDDGSYLYSVTKERVQAKFLGGESGDKVYMLIDEDNKIVASIGKISGKYTAIDVQDAVKDPQNVYISNGHQYDMSQLIDEKTTGEDIVNAITSIDNYKDLSKFIDENHGHDDEDR